ncbi:type II toxin-antitoxin system RelE family toxin [Streptomyces albireticuli]|uniref:Plasmid stabilization protein n=1 Tax=Streptomyces albireticuli TaxID=1940 RepID=A0A2A2D6T0_9ACTN|nr:type II toxin-antitoxin system RelE/ParE family toxin [Streptomyces albireticuli]MCD9143597.1 type II toxin-antitoxin system RelE/ParE family toxin [Streptomyces albireticuli]MCD9161972.1 type II toxin-antitoxin system RelE/ParE family toxin [Streptomyces albireticuli]MCD9191714.1 type II toxin-antitoxin system RelE/ParE family toxin [Streptomyces albireticuli]PAU47224.1 plasmid stabilization protein [Streptomyces albireticuli]
MTYSIIWEPEATSAAVRFLKEDPQGLAALYQAVDALAEDPRPANSAPYGSAYRRLRAGSYRALYTIDEQVIRILVTHIGRTSR